MGRNGQVRALWIMLGVTSLGLGIIGIVLPILPTTPFVLLSAFAFSRSSPRLHAALLAHRTFGPLILRWQTERAIPRRAKIMAVTMMTLVFLGSLLAGVSERVLLIQGIAMGGAAIFVLTRNRPSDE
nr:YbaN family protein [Salipiger sp. HF18]